MKEECREEMHANLKVIDFDSRFPPRVYDRLEDFIQSTCRIYVKMSGMSKCRICQDVGYVTMSDISGFSSYISGEGITIGAPQGYDDCYAHPQIDPLLFVPSRFLVILH